MGYFVFSHDRVQEIVGRVWIPLMVCALVSGVILTVTGFGQDNTFPKYLSSPLNNIYGWLMCLAMMSWFKTTLPISFQFHHTQMDDAHAGKFLANLQNEINRLA